MVPLAFLARLLLLLAIVNTGTLARRGGGDHDGDGDSDSDGSSSSDEGGSSGGDDSSSSSGCGSETPSSGLGINDLVPSISSNWTSQSGARAVPNPTIYDGSYFRGEAHLSYNMTTGPECQKLKELRLLGYAWIGPLPPYPKGAQNPFAIGFKAWQSNAAVSEIHTSYPKIRWEGDMCASEPDLFRITTTTGSVSRTSAWDIMTLDVSADSAISDAVQFNATTIQDLSDPISQYDAMFRLREGTCLREDTEMHWPDTTVMEGSVTNTTINLKFSGSVDENSTQLYVGMDKDLKVNFTVTFSGQFDSVNSTHALEVEKGNNTLTWVANDAPTIGTSGWVGRLVWIIGVQTVIWSLW
ncbi:hypothetical protein P170DRAFT_436463 [Aspergillus steynii IBT 23096]|uniref:Concanavalin A-like lectin/glucanase n=1 Tax=Aspergillus steynii IBT 23096 TaxID=1392250 RepID=A0A2I2G748_9EURO|nr:uncharacterized protein P170DRAFT_436463 [Aspergillus steynii IBT 23096]PLB48685.1 hypothetical protein P170DRAFT_436463 [Aspergillus steynii IBT 23096]